MSHVGPFLYPWRRRRVHSDLPSRTWSRNIASSSAARKACTPTKSIANEENVSSNTPRKVRDESINQSINRNMEESKQSFCLRRNKNTSSTNEYLFEFELHRFGIERSDGLFHFPPYPERLQPWPTTQQHKHTANRSPVQIIKQQQTINNKQ